MTVIFSLAKNSHTHTNTRWNTNLAPIQTMFVLSCKMPWTNQNEVPNMLPTPRIVILLFLKMSPLGQATFSSVVVVNDHSFLVRNKTGVTPLYSSEIHSRTCVLPSISSPKATFIISKFPWHFPPHFKAKRDAGPLFLQVCCFLRYITITNITTHYSAITCATALLPTGTDSADSIYSPLAVKVCTSSSCVNSQSVQKSFDHTMYLPEHKTTILS